MRKAWRTMRRETSVFAAEIDPKKDESEVNFES